MKYLDAIVDEHLSEWIRCQTVLLILPVPDFSMDILSHYWNTFWSPVTRTFQKSPPNELVNAFVTFTPALMSLSDFLHKYFELFRANPSKPVTRLPDSVLTEAQATIEFFSNQRFYRSSCLKCYKISNSELLYDRNKRIDFKPKKDERNFFFFF